jgi:hypothetical protein
MGRPRTKDRSKLAAETLTIRLSVDESEWLDTLVERRSRELSDDGARVTKASFVRGLIRRAARASKLIPADRK